MIKYFDLSGSVYQLRGKIRRAIALFLGTVYYFVFLACYYLIISPLYSYAGITFWHLSWWVWIISIVLSLLPLLFLPLACNKPSDFATWIIYLCLIFPSNIVIFMVSNFSPEKVVVLPIALTSSFLLFELVRQKGSLATRLTKGNASIFDVILPVVMFVLSMVVFSYAQYNISFSFEDVYTRRFAARDIMKGRTLIGYLEAFLSRACIPIALAYGLQYKKLLHILLTFFAILVIFSLSGEKTIILLPVALMFVIFLTLQKRINIGFWLLIFFILLISLSLIEAICLETNIISSYIIRRQMVVPSQLTTYYWEFFSVNPFVMMKDSVIGWLIPVEDNYSIAKNFIVGFEYAKNIETNANANIWASIFADFGYVGMAIISVLSALILKIVDSLSANKFVFACACSAAIGLTWVNGALNTSLLSHGVLALVLALWLYPSKYIYPVENRD